MTRLEDIVGAAVRNLADSAPNAHDLATVARTRGRRIRRRRQATVGAATLALVLVVAAPFVVFRDRQAPPPTTPAPTPSISPSRAPTVIKAQNKNWWEQPYQLPGGVIVTALTRTNVGGPEPAGKTVKDGNVVLDRATGRYWALPLDYYEVWGAPSGPHAIVSGGSSNLLDVGNEGAPPTPIDGGSEALGPQWSRDGERLLDTTENGYVIRDIAKNQIIAQGGAGATDYCPDYCTFTWLADGTEVALPRTDPAIAQSEAVPDTIKDVVVYSVATGKQVRILPVRGVPIGSDAWSRDGRYVIVFDQAFVGRPKHVVDVSTGKTVGRIPGMDVHFLADGRILSIRDTKAEVYDTKGTLLETQQLPNDFADRTVSVGLP